jgi:Asp-tRNA(Asn)/Glu-tRNA(Gln) amidotransferase A subunit family amidase
MALSWSMDKLGPLCRSVEDCGLVLEAIYGPDGEDPTVHDVPFNWNAGLDIKKLRVGYLKADFEHEPKFDSDVKPELKERILKERAITHAADQASLDVMRNKLGVKLIPLEMPDMPFGAMLSVLTSEAAAAFDELTRSGRDKLLTAQTKDDWPNTFRSGRFIPAVEYVNANRARTMGMQKVAKVFDQVDVIVAPTNSLQLVITNLTGHPAVILPNGFRPADAPAPEKPTQGGGPGTPISITFLAGLFQEAKLLAVAKAYQDATDFHLKHPKLDVAAAK